MSNKLKELRAKEGFTIIEVIIVLVIGAVIMLAVFLVVPQLQRTQRNTNRQNAARRVSSALEQYANNNNGSYPTFAQTGTTSATLCVTPLSTGGCQPIANITGNVNAPNGSPYVISQTAIADGNTMFIIGSSTASAGCDANGKFVTTGAQTGKATVAVTQETAASATGDSFCLTSN